MTTATRIATDYTPNEKQYEAHACPARAVLYGGAWGGGKTRWLVEEVLELMLEYPGLEAIIGRFDYNDVVGPTQIWDQWVRAVPHELIKETYMSSPRTVTLVNGSRVMFSGLKDYHPGAEYGVIAIDQAEEVPEETLRLLDGRLRQRLPSGSLPRYRMLLTCNPAPGYLKETYLLHPDANHVFIPALPSDNQEHLPPDYIEKQRGNLTEDEYNRFILGSWDSFVGQAITEWDRLMHVIPTDYVWRTAGWPCYRGIDHGVSNPTICEWLAISPDGDMVFVQEYVRANEIPVNNAKAIAAMSQGIKVVNSWIDPRVAQVKADLTKSSEWSVFNEYQSQGVYCQLAHGTRENRLAAWKQALKLMVERRHIKSLVSPAPKCYIMDCCTELIKELPELQYKEATEGYVDDVVKTRDHAYDAGGFILANLLGRPEKEVKVKPHRQKSAWESM